MNPARNPVGAASPADANQLGACIRSTCLLLAQDAHDAARDVADAFSEATGGGALAGDALCALVGESEVTHHAAGTALVVEGARDDTLYVMLSGHATVRRFGAGEIGRLGPGEFFGEIAGTVGTARTTARCSAYPAGPSGICDGSCRRSTRSWPPRVATACCPR